MLELCPRFDQGMSALLWDLHQRGLLGRTLILAIAEFGRTPTINNRAGRDHWPAVMSAVLAGGGLRVGQAVGSSDSSASYPASTFIAGLEAIRRNLGKPIGSLTQLGTIRLGKRTEGRSPAIRDFVPLANLEDLEFVTTYRGKPLEKNTKSITITLIFRSPVTTLTSDQVESAVQKAIAAAQQNLGATLRG